MAPYFATYLVEKANEANKPDYYLAGLNYPILLMSINLGIGLINLKENNREHSVRLMPASFMNQLKNGWELYGLQWHFSLHGMAFLKWEYQKKILGNQEDIFFGIIIMLIITPVAALGLFFFGKYALQGEYNE